jgi:hypothetical protein
MTIDPDLHTHVALVTAASRGIGATIVGNPYMTGQTVQLNGGTNFI